jgi:hypothetical protein
VSSATAELRAAVARASDVFGRHPAPPYPLDVCLACCVSPEIEQQLRQWTLRALTAHHLYEYNTSAKPPTQSVAALGHFLPRMLELIAAGEDIHHSTELFLVRLGNCPADCWRDDERATLDRFASALFEVVLRGDRLIDGTRRWGEDPLATLLMFDIGGVAIEPLLERWQRCEHLNATIWFVETVYRAFLPDEVYSNAFASDRPAFQQRLRDWLRDASCRRAFADRLTAPEFQRIAATHEADGWTPFPLMVDAVFDYVAS